MTNIQEQIADLRLGVVSATHCAECTRLNDAADTIEKMLAVVKTAQILIDAGAYGYESGMFDDVDTALEELNV